VTPPLLKWRFAALQRLVDRPASVHRSRKH